MNFKACTFERLALIFGFGRGAQVGKTSLLEVNLYGASVDVGRIHFLFGTLQALGSHQNPRYLEEDVAFDAWSEGAPLFRQKKSVFFSCSGLFQRGCYIF